MRYGNLRTTNIEEKLNVFKFIRSLLKAQTLSDKHRMQIACGRRRNLFAVIVIDFVNPYNRNKMRIVLYCIFNLIYSNAVWNLRGFPLWPLCKFVRLQTSKEEQSCCLIITVDRKCYWYLEDSFRMDLKWRTNQQRAMVQICHSLWLLSWLNGYTGYGETSWINLSEQKQLTWGKSRNWLVDFWKPFTKPSSQHINKID